MIKQQIVSRWDHTEVLFECELPEGFASGLAMRHALEAATKEKADLRDADLRGADLCGADLRGADLRGADLRGADLCDADLCGAYLRDADLRDANLCDADLCGAYLRDADLRDANLCGANLCGAAATDEQATENLDKVRAIVLDNKARLNMGHWHQTEGWREHTCAEETMCETTHCLAGWLQVCSTDETVRKEPNPQLAGILAAPIASKMFFRQPDEVLAWLDERKYATEMAEGAKRREEREAAKKE